MNTEASHKISQEAENMVLTPLPSDRAAERSGQPLSPPKLIEVKGTGASDRLPIGVDERPAPTIDLPSQAASDPIDKLLTRKNANDEDKTERKSAYWPRIRRLLKVVAIIAAGATAYYQYLDQLIQTNIGRQEGLFSSTAAQLDSHSDAVRASALSSLFELAFTRTPTETPPSVLSPILNLEKWLIYPPDYRNYDRCARLFSEFAATPRTPADGTRDMVSSQVLSLAVNWINKQSKISDLQPGSSTNRTLYLSFVHWIAQHSSFSQPNHASAPQTLLLHAQVSKAYAPSQDYTNIVFADANLSYSNESYSTFTNVILREANLEGAKLNSATLTSADLFGASLKLTHLDFAHLDGTHLEKAKLDHAFLNNLVSAENARFDEATFQNVDMTGATLRKASFRGTRFTRGLFIKADLSDADSQGPTSEAAT